MLGVELVYGAAGQKFLNAAIGQDGLIQLGFFKLFGIVPADMFELGWAFARAVEIGAFESGLGEVGPGEICPSKARVCDQLCEYGTGALLS